MQCVAFASSMKQHVVPLRYTILILSQPVFTLAPYSRFRCGEATNTNFIVFCLTGLGLEHMVYHSRSDHTLPLHHLYRSEKLKRCWSSSQFG